MNEDTSGHQRSLPGAYSTALTREAGAQSVQQGSSYIQEPSVDLLTAFLQRYDRPATRRAYRNDLTQFFGTDRISVEMTQVVRFVHVNQHIADLEAGFHKPSTIKRRVAALRGFFSWLLALGLIPVNPTDKHLLRRVRAARYQDRAITFLTSEQAGQLVDAAATSGKASAQRDEALILTLLHGVLRRSEATRMDAAHLRPLGPYWVLDLPETKGGADQFIKLPTHVVETIHRLLAAEGVQGGPVWKSYSNNGRGRRLSPGSIYRIVQSTAQRAGLLESVGAHTLRHTGCTLAIEAGASIHQVQAHARHKKIETTMVYVHQRDRLRNSAADFITVGPSAAPSSTPEGPTRARTEPSGTPRSTSDARSGDET
ncbi:MAG: tyrosine-type recombinase/integrase [Bacteroidota bacterium]